MEGMGKIRKVGAVLDGLVREGSLELAIEPFAELDSGRRVAGEDEIDLDFFPWPEEVVFDRRDAGLSSAPSTAGDLRRAAVSAFVRRLHEKSGRGREDISLWDGLVEALAEDGIHVRAEELAQLPLEITFADRLRRRLDRP